MLLSCSISLDHQTQHVCVHHQLVCHRAGRKELQFAVISYGICIADISLPAVKFFPVFRERKLFTGDCIPIANGKPLIVPPCLEKHHPELL